jgi:hypothetical protein
VKDRNLDDVGFTTGKHVKWHQKRRRYRKNTSSNHFTILDFHHHAATMYRLLVTLVLCIASVSAFVAPVNNAVGELYSCSKLMKAILSVAKMMSLPDIEAAKPT